MSFVSFNIYCRERSHRAEVFACSATYASCLVDGWHLWRLGVVRVYGNHLYRFHRTMLGAIVTFCLALCRQTVFLYHYGVSYLYGCSRLF